MALCDLCKGIPFNDLEPPPQGTAIIREQDGFFSFQFMDFRMDTNPTVGYRHQPDLKAWKISASTCALCSFLLEDVTKSPEAPEEARHDPDSKLHGMGRLAPDGQIRLTRRPDGGDGFLVWSGPPGRWAFLVSGVGFCVDDGDAQAGVIRGRPVERHSGSSKSLGRAISWIQRCNSTHPHCKITDAPLPRRVIDVGAAVNKNIRLYEPLRGTRGTYVTLSHCWGTSRHFTTTLETISARKNGIGFQDLPKTFQDAVTLTRHIGVRYLWLDSICICQDDAKDWEGTSAEMGTVYSNSYLNIAASHAKDDTFGCFSHRRSRRHLELTMHNNGNASTKCLAFALALPKAISSRHYIALEDEPLADRAWVLQERCLAPRTLHYATDQMYFECCEEMLSEDGVQYTGRYHGLDAHKQRDKVHRPNLELRSYRAWYDLIQNYGCRKLSKSSDKLPALAGLARRFQDQLGDEYCAGLWRRQLIEGLCWEVTKEERDRTSEPAEYRAPSWSWASIDGPFRVWECVVLATVIECQIKVRGLNPFGEVEEARLKLRAPLEPLIYSEEDLGGLPPSRRVGLVGGDKVGRYPKCDTKSREHNLHALPLFALFIGYHALEIPRFTLYYALIVTPASDEKNVFRRLGMVLMLEHDVRDLPWKRGGEETALPIITLV